VFIPIRLVEAKSAVLTSNTILEMLAKKYGFTRFARRVL
tara:strand:+ start:228 stop:344 length:117 start_codon:yes stop_codon:yes gene_type:complete